MRGPASTRGPRRVAARRSALASASSNRRRRARRSRRRLRRPRSGADHRRAVAGPAIIALPSCQRMSVSAQHAMTAAAALRRVGRERERIRAARRTADRDEPFDVECVRDSEPVGDPVGDAAPGSRRRTSVTGAIDTDQTQSRAGGSRAPTPQVRAGCRDRRGTTAPVCRRAGRSRCSRRRGRRPSGCVSPAYDLLRRKPSDSEHAC